MKPEQERYETQEYKGMKQPKRIWTQEGLEFCTEPDEKYKNKDRREDDRK